MLANPAEQSLAEALWRHPAAAQDVHAGSDPPREKDNAKVRVAARREHKKKRKNAKRSERPEREKLCDIVVTTENIEI